MPIEISKLFPYIDTTDNNRLKFRGKPTSAGVTKFFPYIDTTDNNRMKLRGANIDGDIIVGYPYIDTADNNRMKARTVFSGKLVSICCDEGVPASITISISAANHALSCSDTVTTDEGSNTVYTDFTLEGTYELLDSGESYPYCVVRYCKEAATEDCISTVYDNLESFDYCAKSKLRYCYWVGIAFYISTVDDLVVGGQTYAAGEIVLSTIFMEILTDETNIAGAYNECTGEPPDPDSCATILGEGDCNTWLIPDNAWRSYQYDAGLDCGLSWSWDEVWGNYTIDVNG